MEIGTCVDIYQPLSIPRPSLFSLPSLLHHLFSSLPAVAPGRGPGRRQLRLQQQQRRSEGGKMQSEGLKRIMRNKWKKIARKDNTEQERQLRFSSYCFVIKDAVLVRATASNDRQIGFWRGVDGEENKWEVMFLELWLERNFIPRSPVAVLQLAMRSSWKQYSSFPRLIPSQIRHICAVFETCSTRPRLDQHSRELS